MSDKKKRDLIEEIVSNKNRNGGLGRFGYWSRLRRIESALNQICNPGSSAPAQYTVAMQETLRYIPISTVACIQGFFKLAIKDLIDIGEPYLKRIAKFPNDKVKPPTFEIIAEFQSKSFTVGEFVSHILSFNNYADICAHFTTILDEEFNEKLLTFNKISAIKKENDRNEYFKAHYGEIIESIEITFKMRHTFCHEFAENIQVTPEEIKMHFTNCRIFLEQANDVITNIIYPNYPETQFEMNQNAIASFQKSEGELNELIARIKLTESEYFPRGDDELKKFDELHNKWKEYRDLYADYSTERTKRGSIHKLLYYSELESLNKEMIEHLKRAYNDRLFPKPQFKFTK